MSLCSYRDNMSIIRVCAIVTSLRKSPSKLAHFRAFSSLRIRFTGLHHFRTIPCIKFKRKRKRIGNVACTKLKPQKPPSQEVETRTSKNHGRETRAISSRASLVVITKFFYTIFLIPYKWKRKPSPSTYGNIFVAWKNEFVPKIPRQLVLYPVA